MNKILKIVAIVLAIGFIANSYSSCSLSRKLKQAEDNYKTARRNLDEQAKLHKKRIGLLILDRQKLQDSIANHEQDIGELDASNSSLHRKWSEERKQKLSTIAQAARREEIAANLIEGMGKQVGALKTQINDFKKLTDNLKLELGIWKSMYEDEHELHLKLQKLYKSVKLYGKWKRFGFGLFGGIGINSNGEIHPTAGVGFVIRF